MRGFAKVVGALVFVLVAGCAVKPDQKVAHGQDKNLYSKEELLGRALAEVQAEKRVEAGKAQKQGALTDAVKPFAAPLALPDPDREVVFDVSENYLTVSMVLPEGKKPVAQFHIQGHYDLRPQTNSDGVETQYLVRDDAANGRWQDRAYVALDPFDPLVIKADDDTLRHLYSVADLKGKEHTIATAGDLKWLTPSLAESVFAMPGMGVLSKVRTTLTEDRFSVYAIDRVTGEQALVAQGPVAYFDLKRAKNAKEEELDTLVRDQGEAAWHERLFVALDPEAIKGVEKAVDLMDLLVAKKTLAGPMVYGRDTIPFVSSTPALEKALLASDVAPLKDGAVVTFQVLERSVDLFANQKLLAKLPILGHYDLKNAQTDEGEELAQLVRNTDALWSSRTYAAVDARAFELVYLSREITENSHTFAEKAKIAGQCFVPAMIPVAAVAKAVAAQEVESGAEICFEATQTVLSVFTKVDGKKTLLMTYDVRYFDVGYAMNGDGTETEREIAPNQTKPNWEDRAFVSIDVKNPQIAETHVAPHGMDKKLFEGEFIYTATVVAAHSENGLLFEGANLQTPDRLNLVFDEDTLTAYKVHEPLNDSKARSPVLRYSVDHFDVKRMKNGYGDETNVIAEDRDATWAERKLAHVNFESNQIPGYFNDLLGVENLYSGIVFSASSRRVGEIKVEDGFISYETEEVITPNARAGFYGAGESELEPVAVKIQHVFLKVGKTTYKPKLYTDSDFERFGFFQVTENGIDPLHGKTDQAVKHFMQRFNIEDGKHIDYYLNADYPDAYLDEARDLIGAWNGAMKAATGRDDVIVLHEDFRPSFGDPRYSMIVYIPTRSEASPYGYGPSIFDPTTGENISAKAYIYGDVHKQVLRQASDFYDYATGVRTDADFMVGTETGLNTARESMSRRPALGLANFTMPTSKAAAQSLVTKAGAPAPDRIVKALDVLGASPLNSAAQAVRSGAMDDVKAAAIAHARMAKEPAAARKLNQGCAIGPEENVATAIKFIAAHPGKSKDEIMAELDSRIFFNTLLHELGHNMGLRHNFGGSFDELNFPAKYHELKLMGLLGAPDPAGEDEWLFKYRGSSIMDYNDDLELMVKAAGTYDTAAIKFGYGDKLEKVVEMDDFGAIISEDVPVAQFEMTKAELARSRPDLSAAQVDRLAGNEMGLRPYKFCTDEHVENDPTCRRFDRGTTLEETTASLIEDYELYYKLYGFRRDRRRFTGSSMGVLDRYILPVRQILDEYIYSYITDSFASEGATSKDDYIGAINAGFDFFQGILDTVEPGTYHLDPESGELVSGRDETEGAKNVVIGLGTGKYLKTRVETVGTNEKALNRGVEFDKVFVLYALGLRGYPARKYEEIGLALNYYDLAKEFTLNTFSDFMRDKRMTGVIAVKPEGATDYVLAKAGTRFDPENPAQVEAKIKPSTSLTIKTYARIFAALDFPSNGDKSFADYVDFRLVGSGAVVPEGRDAATFTTSSGTTTYVVPQTEDGLSVTYKIAEEAAALSKKKAELKAGLLAVPKADDLKVKVIDDFAKVWELGEGEAMPDNIREALMGNFDSNIPAVQFLVGQFAGDAQDPEVKAKIEALGVEIEATLAAYGAIAAETKKFQDGIDAANNDLVRLESDLIEIKQFYTMFN